MNGRPAARFLSPHSTTGAAGVVLFQAEDGRWLVYSHHGEHDPLSGNAPRDAFDLFRIFDHGGDREAAIAAAKKELQDAPKERLNSAMQRAAQAAKRLGYSHPTQREAFELVSDTEVETKAAGVSWTVRDFVEENALIVLYGQPGHYKSFTAIDLACSIATGTPWQEKAVQQGLAIYIAGEGHNGLGRRLRAWKIHHNLDQPIPLLRFSNKATRIGDDDCVAELMEQITDAVEELQRLPALIVIDTLARNFGRGDENSTQDMNRFVENTDKLRSPWGCSALVVHHTGHGDTNRERGARALEGAADARFQARYKSETGTVLLQGRKMKDAALPPALALTPEVVALGIRDEDGKEVTSVVLAKSSDPFLQVRKLFDQRHPELKKNDTAFRLFVAIGREGQSGVSQVELREHLADNMPLDQDGQQQPVPSKGTISEALKKLREVGLVDSDNTLTKAGEDTLEAVWPTEEG